MAKARITTSKAQVAPSSTRASENPAAFQAIDFMEKVRQDALEKAQALPKPLKRGPRPADQKGLPCAREVRKALTVHFPPEVSKTLRMIAVQEETTLQALVGEAIDMLLVQRGHKPFGAR